ncbi:MAG: Gfo/Idh/MocA family oxidoreductase [Pseudotabrizicola sp.]|uniref:Gfo/Idh/MocA family protein n=1 Tax=Pseudotabrizicola sp. TaxID=2939647 RepID=UPI0027316ABD|nr:Gfo/Idh/MocA family oxidoreductase [Pseudotabrizicola sp.]MDP2079490.1 Gfo/Idh/MocA family oxidoreductase [Pseudotabrizicola sp.]MDZ7574541.1 Gfo/Idh/MocA family oxidoreductase [Pseudotabrizicola sp.]
MRIGVVGYGTGGRHFHVPFILAASTVDLVGVVARAPDTIAKVHQDLPSTPVFPSLTAMLAAGGIDAVTITTPPQTRRDLVKEAVAAGVHVIADKPFAEDAGSAFELAQAARDRGIILGVYHNRRWDADVLTLRRVLEEGRLGKIWRLHSRMDLDQPASLEAGPTGGLLRDLGSHLVDQTLWLLGPVVSVDAQFDTVTLAAGQTDAGFTISLRHESGVHSHLSASKLNHVSTRELRAYGAAGAYVSRSTDVQAQAVVAGRRPLDQMASWGFEPEASWGVLHTSQGEVSVPSEQGCYHAYYEAFSKAVRTGSPPPVTAEEAIAALQVLDAARISATEGRSVRIASG